MKRRQPPTLAGLLALALTVATMAFGPLASAQDPTDDPNMEIMTRGAVHEAYAEPGAYDPEPGIVIPKAPPADIEEIPPEEKPEGDDVTWIPGYWSWDTDRNDFIWISGIWRIPPPGRSWVPGYWTAVQNGWMWTPGFWMAEEQDQVMYLPQPPESLEIGPSTPAYSSDLIWTPGCWLWVDTHYAWRPGYWVAPRQDWIWTPAHYVWSPRGCVFVDGFWDHPFHSRGVLFAPVYFRQSFFARTRYYYSPSVVIEVGLFNSGLFISTYSNQYCFGDYYDPIYIRRGIRPWFLVDERHRCYDPIFAHQRWDHRRNDSRWDDDIRRDYDNRRDHPEFRPPRTWSDMRTVSERDNRDGGGGRRGGGDRGGGNFNRNVFAASITTVAARSDASIKYVKLDSTQRSSFGDHARNVDNFRDERANWESKRSAPGTIESVDIQPPRGRGNGGGNSRGNDNNNGNRGGNDNGNNSSNDRAGRGGSPNRNIDLPGRGNDIAKPAMENPAAGRRGADQVAPQVETPKNDVPNAPGNRTGRGGSDQNAGRGGGRNFGTTPDAGRGADLSKPTAVIPPAVDNPADNNPGNTRTRPGRSTPTIDLPGRGSNARNNASTPAIDAKPDAPSAPSAGRMTVIQRGKSSDADNSSSSNPPDSVQRVRIPRSPVAGRAAGSPDVKGNPPARPDGKATDPAARSGIIPGSMRPLNSDSPRTPDASRGGAPSARGDSGSPSRSVAPIAIDNSRGASNAPDSPGASGRGGDSSNSSSGRSSSGSSRGGGNGGGGGRGSDKGN